MSCRKVVRDHRIELQDPVSGRLCLFHTVGYKQPSDLLSAMARIHRVAGVAEMAAAADVVGMENVKTVYRAVLHRDCGAGLRAEELSSGFFVKCLFLGKGVSFFDDLIPDADHLGNVILRIFSYLHEGNLLISQ